MKIIPLINFLGKPLKLKTGDYYSDNEIKSACKKYEKQFTENQDDFARSQNAGQSERLKQAEELLKNTIPTLHAAAKSNGDSEYAFVILEKIEKIENFLSLAMPLPAAPKKEKEG